VRRRALSVTLLALLVVTPAAARTAMEPTDPFAPRQWYLTQNRTYDAWTVLPPLAPVRVAVIDSGVDRDHPDLRGRIVAARSFVGGTVDDTQGHGTIVAGLIAARLDDGIGIAGLAPAAELVVAKVVTDDGDIPIEAEAKAIRWAVDQGARVINISLGGLRDPRNAQRDTFSSKEAEAIAYAVAKGALVVAAVGNSDQAPVEPWTFASYPAALPQVLGVGALSRAGDVPRFSNRDAIYVDVVAPGEDVLSTFPFRLTEETPACLEQGYTPCATGEYRAPEGTSFAAPQVTAAAATLLGLVPSLRAEQVRAILERSAADLKPDGGCGTCSPGRDSLSGWGRLDQAQAVAALAGELPPADRFEPNDDAGEEAYRLYGPARIVRATIDFWDDQSDVYQVYLRKGQRLVLGVARARGQQVGISVWRPGTASVEDLTGQDRRLASVAGGATERLVWRARETGWHAVHIKLLEVGATVPYTLTVRRG
jgi:subtilisin family serine protease